MTNPARPDEIRAASGGGFGLAGLDEERCAAGLGGRDAVDRRLLDDLTMLTRHYGELYDTMAPSSLLPVIRRPPPPPRQAARSHR